MQLLTHVKADIFNPFRSPDVEFVVPLSQEGLRVKVKRRWKTSKRGNTVNKTKDFFRGEEIDLGLVQGFLKSPLPPRKKEQHTSL